MMPSIFKKLTGNFHSSESITHAFHMHIYICGLKKSQINLIAMPGLKIKKDNLKIECFRKYSTWVLLLIYFYFGIHDIVMLRIASIYGVPFYIWKLNFRQSRRKRFVSEFMNRIDWFQRFFCIQWHWKYFGHSNAIQHVNRIYFFFVYRLLSAIKLAFGKQRANNTIELVKINR